ncbi:MAG: (d)CMP kinase [Sporolactobacillus sp.]
MRQRYFQVAIDGPAAAGKSTVAKITAQKLGFIYIDTGAMYRSLTHKALACGVDMHDEQVLKALLDRTVIDLCQTAEGQHVFVDGEDVTEQIRWPEVTANVSLVSAFRAVRKEMVTRQRELAASRSVVMDGRDIGTHVLPNADLKIFMKASVEERAARRYREETMKGLHPRLDDLRTAIAVRDRKDSQREVSPLEQAKDAIELDTTRLTIDEVVNRILELVKERRAQ